MIFTVKSIISLVISPVVSATRLGVTPRLHRILLLLHTRCLLLGVRRLFARSVFVGGVFALLARGVRRLRGCGRRPRVLLPLAAAGLRLPLRLRRCRGARARGLAVAARPAAGPGAARGLRGGGGVRRRGRGGSGGAVVALLLAAPPPAGRGRADLPVGGGAVALLAPLLVVMLMLVVVMVLPVVAAAVVRPRVPVMAPAPVSAAVTSSSPVAAAVLLHAVLAAATSPPAVVVVTPAATPANDTKY